MNFVATLYLTLFPLFAMTIADKSDYTGRWQIVETYDEDLQPVELPEGSFYMELKDDDSEDDALVAFMKIGNSMRSKITFSGTSESGDAIAVGGLMSTMMMPPEPLFRFETYLSNTLPKMTTVEKQTAGDTTQLVFSGTGKIVCKESPVPEK